jgi:RimJ/RimL family protein N-acetyltransferase
LLEGKTVNLKVADKDDIDFLAEYTNDVDYWGELIPIDEQRSKSEWVKQFENPSSLDVLLEYKMFIVHKKDGTRIGFITHIVNQPYKMPDIGYNIVPSERRKGHGTEAVQLIVDYLFLSKNVGRIQATTIVENKASQRVLEKVGFKKEGTCRKSSFIRGTWTDCHLYSILREEWKEPKILTTTSSK